MIVALTDLGEESTAPAAEDLFIYAEMLGWAADALASRDPLPGVTEIRQRLLLQRYRFRVAAGRHASSPRSPLRRERSDRISARSGAQ